jgi:hypothetical protein
MSYLDMMQEWLMPQLDDSDGFIYQQGVSTPQYTSSSAVTSISICHKVGSDARLTTTRRFFTGHPDHLI